METPLNARGSIDVLEGKKSLSTVVRKHDNEAPSKVGTTIDADDDLEYKKTLKSRFATVSGGKGIERRDTRGNDRVLVGCKANLEGRSGDGPAADAALAAATAAFDPAAAAAAAAPDAARADAAPARAHEGAGSINR